MKVYISVDIEGVAGITHWDEAEKTKEGYAEYREQMTAEAVAACEGALAAGADEVVVKDAHWTARNIFPERLPEPARLIRGWSGHPACMVQDIDESFHALAMVGYHSAASAGGNPLAHTITDKVHRMLINGVETSEFILHRNTAALSGVPTVFISGDTLLCHTARDISPGIHTVATKEAAGASTTSIHPALAARRISEGVEAAIGDAGARTLADLSGPFELEIWYRDNEDAYKAAHYPGARLAAPHCAAFKTGDFFEIMRMLNFVL